MSNICHKIKLMIKKFPRENKLDYLFRKSLISPHNSWFLVSFCLVWCLPHISHNGSGSSHVLQKNVAITRLFSVEQGPHSISFTILFSLKIKKYIYIYIFICLLFADYQCYFKTFEKRANCPLYFTLLLKAKL